MKLLTFYGEFLPWYDAAQHYILKGMTKERIKHFFVHILGFYKFDLSGLLIGLVFYCFALTPSLIPRTAFFTGLIAGVSFAIGYGLGVLLGIVLRWLNIPTHVPRRLHKPIWMSLLAVMTLVWLTFGLLAAGWQNDVRVLTGVPTLQGRHIIALWFWALVSGTVSLLIGRGIGRVYRFVRRQVERVIPRRVGTVVSIILTIFIGILLLNGVLFRGFRMVTASIFSGNNAKTNPGISQPASALRSGSAASSVSWDSLGRQGRTFIGSGPTSTAIAKFHEPATVKDPIRVYVGVKTASTIRERAELAVKELKRTGAFDRKVLVVATPTGTGWIEPEAVDSLEYLWGGDTAIAAVQYSYLPSWISFLVDQEVASETGRVLFDEVYDVWKTLPADHRPLLYAYGLSLGSFGSQAAFSGQADLANRTDGALFIGSPNFSMPWRYFTDNRDAGSREILPVYKSGQTVRFAATATGLLTDGWQQPRVLYLQHASDPVIWWSYDLLWHKPDWLNEKRGSDVTAGTRWYPFVTFLQVTVDQALGLSVPSGHGHDYSDTMPDAWASLGEPSDWTPAKATELRKLIAAQ